VSWNVVCPDLGDPGIARFDLTSLDPVETRS
jgi:hypothetical protein